MGYAVLIDEKTLEASIEEVNPDENNKVQRKFPGKRRWNWTKTRRVAEFLMERWNRENGGGE